MHTRIAFVWTAEGQLRWSLLQVFLSLTFYLSFSIEVWYVNKEHIRIDIVCSPLGPVENHMLENYVAFVFYSENSFLLSEFSEMKLLCDAFGRIFLKIFWRLKTTS